MDLPRPNEKLFQAADDWHLNACLNYCNVTPGTIADGYKEGADALAVATAERNATLDLAIYPIAFLYRQYLELKIKYIIDLVRRLEQTGRGYPTHHKLDELWTEAVQLLRQHYGADLPKELDNIQCCIDEFQEHDANSMAFRYPTDKQGRLHLKDLRHINLRNLCETMERIGNFLDSFTTDLAERLQCMYEMQAE
jgi:HEPN domain-containing protein